MVYHSYPKKVSGGAEISCLHSVFYDFTHEWTLEFDGDYSGSKIAHSNSVTYFVAYSQSVDNFAIIKVSDDGVVTF